MSKVVKGAVLAVGIAVTGGLLLGGLMVAGAVTVGSAAFSAIVTGFSALGSAAFLNGVSAQLAGSTRSARAVTSVEYSGTVEARRIIYGELFVSGMNVIPPLTNGQNNRYLHHVIAVAGHQVNSIGAVYFGQEAVGAIGSVTGTDNDGLVSTGKFANVAWVRRYTGSSSQTSDYILRTLPEWTTDHRGRGIAYIATRWRTDEKAYPNGQPQVSAVVQGKIVYDPRLDTSPGANPTNPSYFAYSNNPALCLADYLVDPDVGMGESTSRVDWDMVVDAADICDEAVSIPGSLTQNRYTCNIALLATTPYENNIEALAACMLGMCPYVGGKWRMRAGAWELPSFVLSDDNVVNGGVEITTAYQYKDRWNGIRGTYINPNNFYQPDEFPAVQDASYVSADGESVFKDTSFVGCTSVLEAQRNAILLTRKSRNRQVVKGQFDLSAWDIRAGDIGLASIAEIGWSNKTVRVESWAPTAQGSCGLVLREEKASDWTDPLTSDYVEPLNIATPAPSEFEPDPVSALSASPTKNGVVLSWTLPDIFPTGSIIDVYEYTSATPFGSATKVGESTGTSITIPRGDTTTRYYWVQIRMPTGAVSDAFPAGNGIPGAASVVDDPVFIARGNCVYSNFAIAKQGGSNVWDSDVYSVEGYQTAFVSFKANQTSSYKVIGLGADPSASSHYNSIDAAWYMADGGVCEIIESGSTAGIFGSYTASTVFAITYDGSNFRYYKDGVLVRTTAASGLTVYMDSSFYTPGSGISSLRFGPGIVYEIVDTGQIAENAATRVHVAVATGVSILAGTTTPNPSYQSAVSITFVPKVDCEVECTANVEFSQSLPYPDNAVEDGIWRAGGGYGPRNRSENLGTGSVQTLARRRTISVTGGVSETIHWGMARSAPGNTTTVTRVELNLAEVYR